MASCGPPQVPGQTLTNTTTFFRRRRDSTNRPYGPPHLKRACRRDDDGVRVDAAGAGGPRRAGVLARVHGRHAQAGGRHRRGRRGRGAQLRAGPRDGARDGVRHGARLPPALRHRLRPAVHLLAGRRGGLLLHRLPLHGDGRRDHGGAPREAGPTREVHRRGVHPRGHGDHHVPPRRARRVPPDAAVHHPRRRHDGRDRHDRHRRRHEEAPGRRQGGEDPGGDGAGSRRDAAAGDAAAGEAGPGDRRVADRGPRQDGGAHHAAGRHDGAHHGRRVAAGGHPAADRRREHAHRRVHRQQHPLQLPLQLGLLHQGVPAPRQSLCRLIYTSLLYIYILHFKVKCEVLFFFFFFLVLVVSGGDCHVICSRK